MRAAAAGILLIPAGLAVTVAPISSGQPTTTAVIPGNWTSVEVPRLASFTGASVEVDLSWVVGNYCAGFGCGPTRVSPDPVWLVVLDCGLGPCDPSSNGSIVGATAPSLFLSETAFSASPGHDYQLWAFREHDPFTNWNTSVPVTWTVVAPPLGGFLGVTLAAFGVVAIVHSFRRLWPLPKAEPRLY